MREIDDIRYSFRKTLIYDDDIAVLFYKGKKIATGLSEMFNYSWYYEASNYENIGDFLCYRIGLRTDLELDKEDAKESWEHILDAFTWDASSKSYKYGAWELVILDI